MRKSLSTTKLSISSILVIFSLLEMVNCFAAEEVAPAGFGDLEEILRIGVSLENCYAGEEVAAAGFCDL